MLEVFQNDTLVFSSRTGDSRSLSSVNLVTANRQLNLCQAIDNFTEAFTLNLSLQGSVEVVCRHIRESTGSEVVLFRFGFHIGFMPASVFRIDASKLDLGRAVGVTYDMNSCTELSFA